MQNTWARVPGPKKHGWLHGCMEGSLDGRVAGCNLVCSSSRISKIAEWTGGPAQAYTKI